MCSWIVREICFLLKYIRENVNQNRKIQIMSHYIELCLTSNCYFYLTVAKFIFIFACQKTNNWLSIRDYQSTKVLSQKLNKTSNLVMLSNISQNFPFYRWLHCTFLESSEIFLFKIIVNYCSQFQSHMFLKWFRY